MPAWVRRVVLIVALGLAGQEDVPGVVVIVIPLCTVFSLRRIRARIEQTCAIVVVFDDQMDRTSGGDGEVSDDATEIIQDRGLARLRNGMNGVKSQAVEAIAREPMQRILDRKRPYLRSAIIDGVSPRRMYWSEESRRITMEIVTFRAEVVVNNVEQNHEPARMRFIDQRSQIIRTAVDTVGRVEQDSVIAPVSPARKIGDRHQFDRGHTGVDHIPEPLDRGAKRSAGRESSDVKLQNDGLLPRSATPLPRAPFEPRVIDYLAWSRHVPRLEMRCRVGNLDLAVDTEFVKRACVQTRYRGFVPTRRQLLHRV